MSSYALERCCLLNALRYYPSRPKREVLAWMLERWNRDTSTVMAAARELRLTEKVVDGAVWWERPANVVALWWYRVDEAGSRAAGGGSGASSHPATDLRLGLGDAAAPEELSSDTGSRRIYFSVASIALSMWVSQAPMSFLAIISWAILISFIAVVFASPSGMA
jgi:hypothetical protein